MSVEYISTSDQFESRFLRFSEECRIKDTPSIYHAGLDCEYISQNNFPESFERSKNWTWKQTCKISTCILQLASPQTCLVINLCELGPKLPSKLIDILQSGNWLKTGTGINLDMVYLSDNFDFPHYSGCIDVSVMANLAGCETPNMCYLTKLFDVGTVSKNKEDSVKDWSQELTVKMLEYAGNDGFASYFLGERIISNMVSNLSLAIQQKQTELQFKLGIENEKNYVGIIQEYAQKKKAELPVYEITEKGGKFECKCVFMGNEEIVLEKNKRNARIAVAKVIYEKYIKI